MSTSKKIIVVDDSPAILDSVKLMLNMEGFEVSNYERGSDMFNSLLETSTKPDVILMDMWLSGEDGRDICKMIKQHQEFKNIPVVIMSASRGLGDSAIESRAIDFIPKPFDLGEIIEKIRYYSESLKYNNIGRIIVIFLELV